VIGRASTRAYAIAIFVGSGLLFLIEPIAGKRVLPLLGGSAAVWTACLVFFQTALLLGYLTAHRLTTRTPPRTQGRVYLALLALSVVQLAVGLAVPMRADTGHPITSVLLLMTLMIGLPFVTLSITSPLLQSWFAESHMEASGSAYRLYAVSNVGSLLALLAYPGIFEPRTTIPGQMWFVIAGLIVLGAVVAPIARTLGESPLEQVHDARPRVKLSTAMAWTSLAACGSLLLSAVTTHLTRNVAAIPLLWVLPLIAYLLSFVVAFSDRQPRAGAFALGLTGIAIARYRLFRGDLGVPVAAAVAIYCGALFGICLFLHTELYRRRPEPRRLTTFYLCLAIGGAIGAALVGIAAPLFLPGEYELVIGLAIAAVLVSVTTWDFGWIARVLGAAAVFTVAGLLWRDIHVDRSHVRASERNFYGTLQVTQVNDFRYRTVVRQLMNGIIEHGDQIFRADLFNEPTTYYGRSSGVGLAVRLCCPQGGRRIGVIGLGTGTMAAYGEPGDLIRFYDINPAVEPIARNYFSYLKNSKAKVDVVTGDARISLAAEPPQEYDVLVIDAFSSDAIPVHLITAEALALYRRHLSPRGVVAFHVSNRYLALAGVVQQLADNAKMSAVLIANGNDEKRGVYSSDWVLVTSNQTLVDALSLSKDREKITVPPGLKLWTDDYNSLLPILKKKRDED
jgi:SAM-dependent methyltransferase